MRTQGIVRTDYVKPPTLGWSCANTLNKHSNITIHCSQAPTITFLRWFFNTKNTGEQKMDEIKKAKFKNATEIVARTVGTLGVLVPITAALAPIVGLVRSGKGMAKRKQDYGNITKQDIKNALKFYGEHLLMPARVVSDQTDSILDHTSRRVANAEANTPEALAETGVSDLIKLIENAPDVQRRYYRTKKPTNFIQLGDLRVIKFNDTCIVTTEKPKLIETNDYNKAEDYYYYAFDSEKKLISGSMLKFPVEQYVSVDNAAIKRMNELIKQTENDKKTAFGNEVAKRIANNHEK